MKALYTIPLCLLSSIPALVQASTQHPDVTHTVTLFETSLKRAQQLTTITHDLHGQKTSPADAAQQLHMLSAELERSHLSMEHMLRKLTPQQYQSLAAELKGPRTGTAIMAVETMLQNERSKLDQKSYYQHTELRAAYDRFTRVCEKLTR